VPAQAGRGGIKRDGGDTVVPVEGLVPGKGVGVQVPPPTPHLNCGFTLSPILLPIATAPGC